jgi:hypothetical protein
VKWMLVGALVALVFTGCGGIDDRTAVTTPAPPAKTDTAKPDSPTLIVFRRVRYEGATLRTMYVHADGSLKIDVPNGGAGGSNFTGKLTADALREVRATLARTPWKHLTRRRVLYDRSGAYYMLHRRGEDYVAMADGMSADLVPVIERLNDVLNGDGQSRHDLVHRFGKI